jgi:dynein heavy chain, axonemal
MEKLIKFNKDTLDDAMIKKLSKFTSNKEFAPDSVGRVSGAAQGMCLWVHAMKVHPTMHAHRSFVWTSCTTVWIVVAQQVSHISLLCTFRFGRITVMVFQVYGEVAKEVGPKRAKLKAAQDNLAKKQGQLSAAQARLAEVLAAVQALKDQYDASTTNKKALETELADLTQKLERAEKLVTGLAGEKARWQQSIADLDAQIERLPVQFYKHSLVLTSVS